MDSLERRSGQDRRSGDGAAMVDRRRDGGDIAARQGEPGRGSGGAAQLAPRESVRWHRDTTADD